MNDHTDIPMKSGPPAALPDSRADEKPQRDRHGWYVWVAVLMIALTVAVAAWWHVHKQNLGAGTEQSPDAADTQPVKVAKAANAEVPVVHNALGTVTPLATVTVKTQINGRLQSVGFTAGQFVHLDEFLAQVGPRPYEALLKQAQGSEISGTVPVILVLGQHS